MVRWVISLRVKAEGRVGGGFVFILCLLSCENLAYDLSNSASSWRCDKLAYIIQAWCVIASRKKIVKGRWCPLLLRKLLCMFR